MNSQYVYREPTEKEPLQQERQVLGAGDYTYEVLSVKGPALNENERWVLNVKLAIHPAGLWVFANPWSGLDSYGEERDGIGEFLRSCGRAPRPGKKLDWDRVIGAQGRCKLKVQVAQKGKLAGQQVNAVDRFYAPRELEKELPKTGPTPPPGEDDDLNMEPTDIPF